MNILVTGGAGFIGSHVSDALIAAGNAVTIIDDLSTGRKEHVNPDADFYQLDIRSDRLFKLFKDQRFDAMVHLAAQIDVRKSVEDPVADAAVNIVGTLNLLEMCRQHGVAKVVFASTSGAIYGEQERFPADENHPTFPVSPYGVTKLAVEKYLHYYRTVYGLEYVSLRFANVYGPRQNASGEAGVIAIFASKMLAGEKPLINGDGNQTRDYVYVDDVVKANLLALTHPSSAVFNVGTGIETTVNELFRQIRTLTGSDCEEAHGSAKSGEQLRSSVDSAALGKMFGWQPSVTLAEGLPKTVAYFKSARGK